LQKRSNWKNQFKKIDSSSDFHEIVREIFTSDPFFKNLSCYQEVPVSSLVSSYRSNHYVDWYIDELGIILELHGQQHYKITNFGNSSWEETRKAYNNIRYRDNKKKTALENAGFEYREISYKKKSKLNSKLLKEILFQNKQ